MPQNENVKHLIDVLKYAVARFPNETAIIGEGYHFTYSEFNHCIISVANELNKNGVNRGDMVGICLDRSAEMVVAIFAVLATGAAYVPMDTNYPGERVKSVFEDAGVKVVITHAPLVARFNHQGFCALVPVLNDEIETGLFSVDYQPSDNAYVLFTSGSTGIPKGVMVPHSAVVNLLNDVQNRYPITKGDVVMLKSPYTFDGSIWELFGWMAMGAMLLIAPVGAEKDPVQLVKLINRFGVNFLFFVPSMLNAFVDYAITAKKQTQLASLKWVSVGGEVLPVSLVNRFYELVDGERVKLINVYGPTETTVYATTYLCNPTEKYTKIPIGENVTNDNIYILDETLNAVAEGEEGEICIGGAGVANGYLNRPELTAERFVNDPFVPGKKMYRTGDIGKRLPSGMYDFIGRRDFQVKLRGLRIELGEIENAVQQISFVSESAVVFAKDRNGDDAIVAYLKPVDLLPEPDSNYFMANESLKEAVIASLSAFLPQFMIPGELVICRNFPLTPNGKIDKRALKPVCELCTTDYFEPFVPQNETEEALLKIWCKILGKESVATDATFFQSGGHSLKAIQVITEVIKQFGVELPLQLFYGQTTLPVMATHITNLLKANFEPEVYHSYEPNLLRTIYPLTPVQNEMWVMNSLDSSGLTHNIHIEFIAKGKVDKTRLLEALRVTIQNEEMLRSALPVTNDGPVQEILQEISFHISESDFSQINDSEKEAHYAQVIFENGHILFDFNHPPLFSIRLIKWNASEYRLLMSVHHIVFDGWSLQLFMSRWRNNYVGIGSEPQRFRHGDYALQLQSELVKGLYAGELDYWKLALNKIPNRLLLPRKPDAQPYEAGKYGRRLWWSIPEQCSNEIDLVSTAFNTTPFVFMMCAYQLALGMAANQNHVVVGTPFANRKNPMVTDLIGYYTNMVSINMSWSEDDTFADMLQRCNEASIGAFSHANLPFGELVKQLDYRFEPGVYPIFQAIFVMQNWPHNGEVFPGFTLTQREIGNDTCKMDMMLNVERVGGAYHCFLEYDTMLFDEFFVEKLSESISTIASVMVAEPHAMVQPEIANIAKTLKVQGSNHTCIVVGEGTLAIHCAQILLQNGFVLYSAVTTDIAFVDFLNENKVPVYAGVKDLSVFKPVDFIFSINNSLILNQAFTALAMRLAVNYHDAPLPKYAGMFAPNRALINGEMQHGISWHVIVNEIDAGDIVVSKQVPVYSGDTAFSLNTRCYEAAIAAFNAMILAFKKNEMMTTPQKLSERTYFGLAERPSILGLISWQMSVDTVGKLLNACDFGPNRDNEFMLPVILVQNQLYFVGKASVRYKTNIKPGFVSVENNAYSVAIADGCISFETLYSTKGQLVDANSVFSGTRILAEPDTEKLQYAEKEFAKQAKNEPFWKRRFESVAFMPNPVCFGIPGNSPTNLQTIHLDHLSGQIAGCGLGNFEVVAPAMAVLFSMIVSRQHRATIGLVTEKSAEISAASNGFFSCWLPWNVSIDRNESVLTNLQRIVSERQNMVKHGLYRADLRLRYTALLPESQNIPAVFINESSSRNTQMPQGTLEISMVNNSVQISGCNDLIGEMFSSFTAHCVERPNIPMGQIPLMSRHLLQKTDDILNNQSAITTTAEDVYTLFRNNVSKHPRQLAVYYHGIEYSYAQFGADVMAFASELKNKGVTYQSVVAINLPRSYEYFVALMAVLHCSAVFVPVDPGLPADRQLFLINDSGSETVIVSDTNTDLNINGVSILLPQWSAQPETVWPMAEPRAADLAYIIYTSGSTGIPKGVKISRQALANFISGAIGLYGFNSFDRILQFSNLGFDAAIEEIFGAFCSGASLYPRTDDMLSVQVLIDYTMQHGVTVWDLPTAFWREVVSQRLFADEIPDCDLRVIIIGGEAVTLADVALWNRCNHPDIRLFNTYGPTETTVVALAHEIHLNNPYSFSVPIGRPLPGFKIAVCNASGQMLPPGLAGELHIGGVSVSNGYVNVPDPLSLVFYHQSGNNGSAEKWYKTGDLVVSDMHGVVYYLGRTDAQLKIRGFRVEPGEVEAAVLAISGVENCAVIAFEKKNGEKALAAFFTGKSMQNNAKSIRLLLKERLPDYMVPEIVVHTEKIPLTPNGKVDKKALTLLANDAVVSKNAGKEKPETVTEQVLHQLWCDILQIENIGIRDDFFELGGHSLKAVKMAAGIKKSLDIDLPLASLISYPTIKQLAALIDSRKIDKLWNIIVPIRSVGSLTPLFLIHGAGLNVLLFQSLSKYLNADRPIYALQAKGLDGKQAISTSIEEMAHDYIAEIQKIQPVGPYHLFGFSIGGFIAYEMARCLTEKGYQIAFLGVIDSVATMACDSGPLPLKIGRKAYHLLAMVVYLVFLFLVEPWSGKRHFLKNKWNNFRVIIRYIGAKLNSEPAQLGKTDSGNEPVFMAEKVKLIMFDALKQYRIKKAPVKLHLFKAAKATFYIPDRKRYGWGKFASEGVVQHTIPGEHSTMFAPPNDSLFSEILDRALTSAEPVNGEMFVSADYLLKLAREIAGNPFISFDDHLIDVGFNSLRIIRFIAALERDYGISLTLTEFYSKPNIARLAEYINRECDLSSRNSIVTIKQGDAKSVPMFVIDGFGLKTLAFHHLATHFPEDQTVYVLQACMQNGELLVPESVELLAEYYINQIKTIIPTGPIHLVGFSFGGFVVYEMARQLTHSPLKIVKLSILDTSAYFIPAHNQSLFSFKLKTKRFQLIRFVNLERKAQIASLKKNLGKLANTVLPSSLEIRDDLQKTMSFNDNLYERSVQMIKQYRMTKLEISISLVTSDSYLKYGGKYLGWEKFVSGTIEVLHLNGAHLDLFSPEKLDNLAQFLITIKSNTNNGI